jgi:hypothetical protein
MHHAQNTITLIQILKTVKSNVCYSSVDKLELKIDQTLNKPLHIESIARYKYHMQVKKEYCYIHLDKES